MTLTTELKIMRLIRISEVMNKTSLAKSTIYKYMTQGEFPPAVQLSKNFVAWVEEEVEEWIATKISDRDFDSIESSDERKTDSDALSTP
ncbi:AlpA family phage regulatory protein [Litoribrevibacter albus]|nr:AlpA family phage regulatory protein [Litoribrevibacter albus]